MGDSERSDETRFLPPEPAGPEPELEDPPAQPPPQPPPPPQQQQQQTYGYPPQAGPGQPAVGAPPPPPGQPYYSPPPGYGYQPPPPGYPPPGQPPYPPPGQAYPAAWGYPQPRVPDNGQAVAGFVFSLVSIGLLVISAGFSSIVSVGCAITGIICSRNGKRKVDAGETPKHRGLAQAGFVIGWVSLVLSVLATAGWILFIVLAATDEDFDWESAQVLWS